jgi:hypothetical protein
MSGGRRVVQGRDRLAVAGGLVVRALLIGVIGFALGMLTQESGVEGILPFYAVLFLLAIPLLGLPPLGLAGLVAAVVVVGPVLCVAAAQAHLPYAAYTGSNVEPSFATLAPSCAGAWRVVVGAGGGGGGGAAHSSPQIPSFPAMATCCAASIVEAFCTGLLSKMKCLAHPARVTAME